MNLEKLLRSADRPRDLSPDELERLRGHLGIDPSGSGAEPGGPVLIDLTHAPVRDTRPPRARLRQLAVAAVVLAVVGVAISTVAGRGSKPETVVADQSQSTTEAANPLVRVCAGQLVALTNALEAWGGVGNWALTSNGQPDLRELLVATLTALTDLDSLRADATRQLAALEDELGDPAVPAATGRDAVQRRETALTDSVTALIATLRAANAPGECDLDRLEAAI